jgi:hypothetical protein
MFPVLLMPLMIAAVIYFVSRLNSPKSNPLESSVEDLTNVYYLNPDTLKDVRDQHEAVLALLKEHAHHPVVKATRQDIEREASSLMGEAEQIAMKRNKLKAIVAACAGSERDIDTLRLQILAEDNPKIKSVLESTLERKRTEIGNIERVESNIRYFEALISQAEATLSELRSRIGLALSETEDYTNPRVQLAVDEANRELRSVSDAMRDTLQELDASSS